jgi:hypothetical protein
MGFQNGWRGPDIVADGLVLYLDAGSPNSYRPDFGTTWKDMSGNNYTGSLVNGPTYSTASGGSIFFDGVDDNANLGNILFNSASVSTVDIWVNFPSMAGNKYVTSKGSAGDGIYTFIMVTGPGPSGGGSSYVRFSMGNQSSTTSTNIEYGSLNWGQWYNFTFTYNGSFVTGYRNAATPISSSLTGNLYTTSTPIYLARDKYGVAATCNIAGFKIYNRSLSATEVLQNYNAQKSRFGL